MLRMLRARLTYANVVATFALVFAMTGGAYALVVNGALVQDESLTEADIRDGSLNSSIGQDAITGANVAADSLTGDDVDEDSLSLAQDDEELRGRVAALEALLTGVTRSDDTLTFAGVNLQLVNGMGSTLGKNGLGNLIVGYNAGTDARTGSHNVVIGDQHTYTGAGGLVSGLNNRLAASWGVALGWNNNSTGFAATVTGGFDNTASGQPSSVSGGLSNTADGFTSSILGGQNITLLASSSLYPAP